VQPSDSAEPKQTAPSPLSNPAFRKLLAISVTVALGYGLVVPILPNFARSFDVSLAAVGLVFFVFGLTRFLFGLVGGLVVDRFGDRFSVMAGLLIVAASSYASGLAASFPQLVAARGFGGAGSAFFIAGLMNRIIRTIEPEAMGRATGQFRSSFLVGISVGPLLGGILAKYFGDAATFHVYGTGLLLAAVIAYFVMAGQAVDRTAPRSSPLESLRKAAPLLRDRRYVLALAATFVGWWVLAGPAQTIGPVFAAEELDFSKFAIGAAVTLLSIGEVLVLFAAGSAADRLGRKAVLVPSLVVTAVAVALVGQIEQMPWAYFPLMVAAGAGVAAGSTAAGGLLADSIRGHGAQQKGGSGAAVGVNQMAGDLGYLLAPTTVGFLAEVGGFGLAFLAAAVPAALLLAWTVTLPNYRAERVGDAGEPEATTEPGSVTI
jgi:DHA1 family multidrug resistance protein-like MFS transporter